jgi:hypothetical protein
MSKFPLSLFTLVALAFSVAQAQTVGGTAGQGTYQIDGSSATVGQTINLSIPKRFGLHLHRNTWTLDLTNLKSDGTVDGDGGDANCWRAGNHSSALGTAGTGRDTLYGYNRATYNQTNTSVTAPQSQRDDEFLLTMASVYFQGDQAIDPNNPYSMAAQLLWGDTFNGRDTRIQNGDGSKLPIGGYPGFYVNNNKLEWKGPIMCSFQTIVQKFANSTAGWQFTGSLAANTGSSFPFAVYTSDVFSYNLATFAGVPSSGGNPNTVWRFPRAGGAALRDGGAAQRLASGRGVTTGGWLDDHLLEVIVFDGSVAAGTYSGTVTFALADWSAPTDINGL